MSEREFEKRLVYIGLELTKLEEQINKTSTFSEVEQETIRLTLERLENEAGLGENANLDEPINLDRLTKAQKVILDRIMGIRDEFGHKLLAQEGVTKEDIEAGWKRVWRNLSGKPPENN